MQTYGPFYPSSVQDLGGGSTWSNPGNAAGAPDGNSASTTVEFDSSSGTLKSTGFGANIPADRQVREVRFQFNRDFPPGLNEGNQQLLPSGEDMSSQGSGLFVYDNTESSSPLTPDDVNAADFGILWSAFNLGDPQSVSVESIALYIEVE